MSDTPITDKEAYDYATGERCLDGVVSADVVRKLERENAALRKERDTFIKCIELALCGLDSKNNQAAVLTLNVALDAARKDVK